MRERIRARRNMIKLPKTYCYVASTTQRNAGDSASAPSGRGRYGVVCAPSLPSQAINAPYRQVDLPDALDERERADDRARQECARFARKYGTAADLLLFRQVLTVLISRTVDYYGRGRL